MNVVINRSGCISCTLCCELCPDVFGMEDSLATCHGPVTDENKDAVQNAIDSCPVSVISFAE